MVCDRRNHTLAAVSFANFLRGFFQYCFVDLAAKTKSDFAPFDFFRFADLYFHRHGADDRRPVAVTGYVTELEMLNSTLSLNALRRALTKSDSGSENSAIWN